MTKLAWLLVATGGALAAGCSVTPSVTREVTTMTPQQIAEAGLECRPMTPIDSSIPRTICASDRAWAAYERRARLATDELLAEGRKLSNVGRFNRD